MKNFFKYLFIFTISFTAVFVSSAFAATDVIGEKVLDLPNNKGQVQVSTQKSSETLGRPYRVELRVNCSKQKTAQWKNLDVVDSESVCDVKPQSAKLTSDGKYVSVMIRETDAEAFNEQSKSVEAAALGELQPQCQKKARLFLFPIEKYCLK